MQVEPLFTEAELSKGKAKQRTAEPAWVGEEGEEGEEGASLTWHVRCS